MRKKLSGYFTVEAAFIMPIVIFLLALLCYLGFFLCNRCMILQDTYIMGLRGSIVDGLDNAETATYILKQGTEIQKKFYAVSGIDKSVKVGMREITVLLQCKMKVPLAFLSWEKEKMDRIWKICEEKKFDRTDPVDFIRACRKVEKFIE